MRILYVTPEFSFPPRNGGQIRKWNILQGLLQAGDTDAIVFSRGSELATKEAFHGCRKVIRVSWKHLHLNEERHHRLYRSTLGRGLITLGSSLPLEYCGDARDELRKYLRESTDLESYDVVFFATARMIFPLGRISTPVQILDGDDFSYVREWLLLRNSHWYGAKIWNYIDVAKTWWWERRFATRLTAVLRCSREDKDRHPAENVVVVPNGTWVPATLHRSPECSALFVGELGYPPNHEGVEWFLKNVWPGIREQLPEARFDIVGRSPTPFIQAAHGKDGVVVHGFVGDLEPLYRRAGISVVPLHAGGGTRLKILESLARGVPVISTSIGAFGIEAHEPQGLARTDDVADFQRRCVSQLHDTQDGFDRAMAGREIIKNNYDWLRIQQQIAELARTFGTPAKQPQTQS